MNKELVYKLLWSTIEEFVGSWEMIWEVNTLRSNGESKNKELTEKILIYFIEDDLVKFYQDKWGYEELREITSYEAIKLMKEEKFWLPPQVGEVCVKIGSTKKGKKYYNERLIDNTEF